MKRYAVCREYLIPVYQYVEVFAENTEQACQKALDDFQLPWDGERYDHESAGPTYIGAIAEVPEGVDDPCPYDLPNDPIPDAYTSKTVNEGHF